MTEKKEDILFNSPLGVEADQIVFEDMEIELVTLRNDTETEGRKIQNQVRMTIGATTATKTLSFYKIEELEKAKTEHKNLVQRFISGKKIVQIKKVGNSWTKISMEIVDKSKKSR